MSGVHYLKVVLNERLAAMAQEISELFERMIALHEREMRILKQRNTKQQQLLDAMLKPRIVLHRTDVHIVSQSQVEIDPRLDLGDTEPPHIKEEQEELYINQEQEELQEFTFTPLSVKSEDDEDKPPQLQRQPPEKRQNPNGKDCGVLSLRSDPQTNMQSHSVEEMTQSLDTWDPENMTENRDALTTSSAKAGMDSSSDHSRHLQSDSEDQTQNSSDTEDSEDWALRPQSYGQDLKRATQSTSPVCRSRYGRSYRTKSLPDSSNTVKYNESVNGEGSKAEHECPQCLRTFQCKSSLEIHTQKSHSKMKPFCCLECSARFNRQDNLIRHMTVHSREKPFTCSVCKKGFTREDNLSSHMLYHKGKKPYTCTVCQKSFTESGHLKTHMRTHTGEKPFSCSVCKKCFTDRGTRNRHERSHTGERPFSCSECGTEFKQKEHYLSHLKVHSGERPFSCPMCQKCFARKSHVTSHMKVHTKKAIRCTICQKVFTCNSHYKQHTESHLAEETHGIT